MLLNLHSNQGSSKGRPGSSKDGPDKSGVVVDLLVGGSPKKHPMMEVVQIPQIGETIDEGKAL